MLTLTEGRADAAVRTRLGDDDGPGVWWEGLRAIIGNRYVAPLTRHILVSTTCGTYMTRSLAHKWGYLVQPLCPDCRVPDTPAHRVLECTRFCAGRLEQGDRWDEAFAACRSCGDEQLRDLLLPLRPQSAAPPPSSILRAFRGDEEIPISDFKFVPSEPGAGDGSA